jgi:hypothetical protein
MLVSKIIENFQHLSRTHSHILSFLLGITLDRLMNADYYFFSSILCDDRSPTSALLGRTLVTEIIFAMLLNISGPSR